MVRVSKRFVPQEVMMKLYNLVFQVVSHSTGKERFFNIFEDIFSPTEKMMIAKRVAIIYLLIKGIEQKIIADKIKVSTATVSKYAILFHKQNSPLTQLLQYMIKKEKVLDFLEDIFADIFIQPGIKIGHHKLKYDYDRRKLEKKYSGL